MVLKGLFRNALISQLLLLFALLNGFTSLSFVSAQDKTISRHYSMKDGLSHDYATCLLQDSQGFIWVGTYSGLNRFDGYHFTTYRGNPAYTNSLSHNQINCLWEDGQQRLWIGTPEGLDLFDLKSEKFTHISLDTSKAYTSSITNIRELNDGTVLICKTPRVFQMDPHSLTVINTLDLTDDPDGEVAWDVAETKDGAIWVSSNNGRLVSWDLNTGQSTRYRYDTLNPLSQQNHKTVYVDSQDRIWLGGSHSIALFDPDNEEFTPFSPSNFNYIDVNNISEALDGKLWISSGHGLDIFNPVTGQFESKINQGNSAVLNDRQGNTWIGGIGVYQIAPTRKKIDNYHRFGPTEVLDVRVYTEDTNHNIWIAVWNPNQLFRFDPYSREFIQYLNDPNNPHSYSGNMVHDIIPSSDGGVWLASHSILEKFNPIDHSFSQIAVPGTALELFTDSKNTLWIGTYMGAYYRINQSFENIPGFPQIEVRSFVEDREQNIWIGTPDGLFRYNLKTDQLDVFKKDPTNTLSISHNRVWQVMMDQHGTIWIGTGGGLNKILPGTESNQPKFVHWKTDNSNLAHDDVWGVIDGLDGTLWLSSGNQVSQFFPETEAFKNYDHLDGLPGQAIYRGVRGQTGEIYISSRDGMVVFHPDSLQENTYEAPLVITNFFIRNQPVAVQGSKTGGSGPESTLTIATPYAENINLTHRQNDFALEFAALNYVNPENNRYKYKLEPYESDWIETTADNRIARYTNIRPGSYTFRVIGSNNDGLWNETGQSIFIMIHPPWWQTWWAYAAYVLGVLGLVLALWHYERKRFILNQKANSLEEIDKVKSEFFTNISHELRTPLTLILGPLKALQDGNYGGDKSSMMKMMSQNGRRLLQLVNQLLDLAKLDQGKLQLELQDCHINELIRQVLANFDSACAMKHIELEFIEDDIIHSQVDLEKMRQILYNLIGNASKFTPEGGQIQVSVYSVVQQQGDNRKSVKIVVKDSGIGIARNKLDQIFDRFYQVKNTPQDESEGTGIGLALTKKLVELHHGIIEVESQTGWGSTFTVTLPLVSVEREVTTPIEGDEPLFTVTPVGPDSNGKPQKQTAHSKPILLLVEDNAQMRQYTQSCLGAKYQYLEASNGIEGLKLVDSQLPDLILCDVMMPEIDGYVFCQQVRAQAASAHIPFIFLTARADLDSRLQGLEIGSNDYVTKPFEPAELQLKVRNHLYKMQQHRVFFSKQLALKGDIELVESLDGAFLNKAIEAVENQIDDHELNVQELSRQLGISQTQLYRKLMTLTGLSPSAFIRSIRLKKAAQLIVQDFGNTSEVAYAVGFNNLSYFAKCFKEQFGVAPSGYGKKSLKQ